MWADGFEEFPETPEGGFLAEQSDDVEEGSADGRARQRQAGRMDELAGGHAGFSRQGAQSLLEEVGSPVVETLVSGQEFLEKPRRLG